MIHSLSILLNNSIIKSILLLHSHSVDKFLTSPKKKKNWSNQRVLSLIFLIQSIDPSVAIPYLLSSFLFSDKLPIYLHNTNSSFARFHFLLSIHERHRSKSASLINLIFFPFSARTFPSAYEYTDNSPILKVSWFYFLHHLPPHFPASICSKIP